MDPYPSNGLIRSYNVFRAHSTGYAQNQMIGITNIKPNHIQSDSLYWAVRQIQTANNERNNKIKEEQNKHNNVISQIKPRRIMIRKSAPATSLPIHALMMRSPQTTNTHDPMCNLFDDDEAIELKSTTSCYDERSNIKNNKQGQTLSSSNRAMTRGEQLMEMNNNGTTRRSRMEQHQSTDLSYRNETRSISRQKRSADEIWTIEASGTRSPCSDSDANSSPSCPSLMDSKRRRVSNLNIVVNDCFTNVASSGDNCLQSQSRSYQSPRLR